MSERSIVRMVEALRGSAGAVSGGIPMAGIVTRTSPLMVKTGNVEISDHLYLNPLIQPSLVVGDTVVLIRMQDSFYVICKVVKVS